eukprot:CAMPEP_0197849300 /NCGR_PEP_ID=MMETSP1438-20131217/11548_1 /TAXON_ID=1461541 /ORGANISM="Pterosperma sp., Strain CCMP1384" /LENGTH=77 /DNA_ID=CAMNT_0043461905 /DNA_START=326 /DNA_END=556 /DNA_ORIENTATION=-
MTPAIKTIEPQRTAMTTMMGMLSLLVADPSAESDALGGGLDIAFNVVGGRPGGSGDDGGGSGGGGSGGGGGWGGGYV